LLWQRPFPSERAWFHLSFRPDSRQVAISSRDVSRNYRAELQLWNLEDGASRSLVQAESKGPFGQFVLTATGRYLQYHDPPWVGNTPWPSSEDTPSIVGGWWRIHENEARPAITFDDDGHWYDGERTKHAIFSPSEKNQERRIGQRHANMNRVGHTEGIEVPGVQANLSPDERWLAMRLTFVVPKDVDTGRSIRPADSWHYELHLIDLHDGSRSPIIHDAERWTFSPDGKTLITAGDGNLRVWLLPLENITSQRWVFGLLAIVLCCLQIRLVTPWLRESP
jgi:WD40 repeat protein